MNLHMSKVVRYIALSTIMPLATSPLSAATNSLALEEIIVTAQKRLQTVNEVPMAITAFDAALVENAGIASVMSIAQMTPGLTLSSYNKTTPAPYIRGIGTNNSHVADDPSVSVFIDEVYISRPGSLDTQLFDIERIEVLRGPQGTLWGKNVAGGAIVLVTRQPADSFDGRIFATVGNFDLSSGGVYLNGPLSNAVSGKISLFRSERDGYIDNVRIGGSLNDEDVASWRGGLLWQPQESLEIQWNLDHSRDDNNGVGRVALSGTPAPVWPIPLLDNYGKTASFTNGFMQRWSGGTSLHVQYEVGDTQLTSITAYRKNDYQFLFGFVPFDVTIDSFIFNQAEEESSQFSQELRLNRYDEQLAIDWTVGAYFFTDDVQRDELLLFSQADASNETGSQAVFGQMSKALDRNEVWNLTLGLRYTEEEKSFKQFTVGAAAKEDWSNLSYKSSIDYTGWQQGLIYLSYSEGFKSGAFNAFAETVAQAQAPLDPELSSQWELGVKLHWLDRSLRTNLLVFHTDYEDIQVFETRDIDLSFYIINATAISKGSELDIIYQPLPGLELSATYSYLDARYDQYVTESENFSGNLLQRAPRESYTSAVQYVMPVQSGYELLLRADLIFQDDVFYSSSNNPNQSGPQYSLLNIRANLTSPDQHWQFSLWGKNINDEDYVVFENDMSSLVPGVRSSIPGAPRTYGLTVHYRL